MRVMEIPPFAETVEITDLESLYKARLTSGITAHGTTGVLLLSHMLAPNDAIAHDATRPDGVVAVAATMMNGPTSICTSRIRACSMTC